MGAKCSGNYFLLQDGLNGSGQSVFLGLCLGQILAQGGEVGFDLGLGTGGAHHNGSTVLQAVDQDIGGGQPKSRPRLDKPLLPTSGS